MLLATATAAIHIFCDCAFLKEFLEGSTVRVMPG